MPEERYDEEPEYYWSCAGCGGQGHEPGDADLDEVMFGGQLHGEIFCTGCWSAQKESKR